MELPSIKSYLAKKDYVRRTRSATAGYQPINFKYTTSESGDRVYEDHNLNILQANLITIYELVDDVRTQAQLDLLTIQNNLNTQSTKNPTVENIGWMVSKCIEASALIFPAGTITAVVAGLTARLLSGATQALTKDKQSDSYNAIQSSVNNTRDSMLETFDQLKKLITSWNENMEAQWHVEYDCPGIEYSGFKGKVTLSELATYNFYFPKKGMKNEYDQARNELSSKIATLTTKVLLPVKYKIYEVHSVNSEDSTRYCPRWFWAVSWYETSSTSKWNTWRGRKEFPAIPNDLQDSVGGPWEDIGAFRDIKGGYQYWQGFDNAGEVCEDDRFSPDHQYYWTRMSNHRWMYWGGRNCSRWDAKEQGSSDNSKVDQNGNIIQGTPFLDFFDDVCKDTIRGYGYYWGNPVTKSLLVWYKLNDGTINNRDVRHMTTVDYCNDWFYQKNIFKWNWAYRGIQLRFYALVDKDGNYVSDTLTDWLFKDDGYGNTTNPHGIASRIDVYHNWGLEFY